MLGGPQSVTHTGPHFPWPPISAATTGAVLGQHPVWHDPDDGPLVDAYLRAFRKVIDNHEELLP